MSEQFPRTMPDAMRSWQRKYQRLSDAAFEGIFFHDAGRIIEANGAAAQMFGYALEELIGLSVQELAPPASVAHVQEQIRQGSEAPYEAIGRRKDGTLFPVEIRARSLEIDGRLYRVAVIRDITQRTALIETLRQSEARFRSMFDHAPIGMAMVATDGEWLQVNPALCALLGYDEAELLGRTFQEMTHPDDLPADLEKVKAMLRKEISSYQIEKRHLHRAGHAIWTQLSASLVYDERDEPLYFIAQIQDISTRKQAERRALEERAGLEELSRRDGLTGLTNYRTFHQRLEKALSYARRRALPLSVVLLDVDHFKSYNDSFGHPAGNEVLIQLGTLLQAGVRDGDTVARYGGEEFALLLPGIPAQRAFDVAERIRLTVEQFSWPRRAVTLSAGVATLDGDPITDSALLAAADRALYRAKALGRNRVCCASDT